jgi:hypothetical protein
MASAGSAAGGVAAAGPAGPVVGDWSSNVKSLRGQNGSQFAVVCPAGGSLGSVWGTDVYTDDSSVCSAALHAGLVTTTAGGSATIEIRPGATSYTGSARNGVTSGSYGSYSGSYVFAGGKAGGGAAGVSMGGAGWTATPAAYRARVGERFAFVCPAGGTPGSPWGTDTYTDDSSVCSAAVHVGLISAAAGGTVTVELRAGLTAYVSSAHNGVTSRPYGGYAGSFVFPGAKPVGTAATTTAPPPTTTAPPTPAATTTATPAGVTAGGSGWAVDTRAYRSKIGARYSFVCTAGGRASTVWGTNVYTDDSSVCNAAVHTGLISMAAGGTVTVEIRPGLSGYTGSTRNGITTHGYGAWHGTFVFVR